MRVGEELREAAAARLVSTRPGSDRTAGRRFIANARALGIDLSLMWATPLEMGAVGGFGRKGGGDRISQVCLAVVGAGRTATLFVSGAPATTDARAAFLRAEADRDERVRLIQEACRVIAHPGPETGRGVRLAQSLLDPGETAALAAFLAAGFSRLGDLDYLRRPLPRSPEGADPTLPDDVRLVPLDRLGQPEGDRLLAEALARSYIDTLDCPELAGLRELPDVIESHRAVGRYDPALWWIVMHQDQPEGCMLLTRCPESSAVELVYLGLGPSLRGRGVGSALLRIGLNRIAGGPEATVTCAVDTRNTPAQRLYKRAGFDRFASRIPLIRPLRA